jgi:hypothetical protein
MEGKEQCASSRVRQDKKRHQHQREHRRLPELPQPFDVIRKLFFLPLCSPLITADPTAMHSSSDGQEKTTSME